MMGGMDISSHAIRSNSRIIAVLGPTNTGKTHAAIERMLSFKTGCIGFPLRLLARENYDRVVKEKGVSAVALVTGEEKIIPKGARYYICTVESMPVDNIFEFLAVDEVQLCADPDRGHVFTDRLLRARGAEMTMFMGAETIRPLLRHLIPGIEFEARERLSQLTYTGFKKLTRLPKRSAVVAFSVNDVYAFAELVRRHRGGTAVVLGALSPRTRNRQVEMYQAGEVDFLVATDAIGMGLNMDIHHIALAGTRKYDGHQVRNLERAELAQIAGRAGRYRRDGTFGTTGFVHGLDDETIEAIETHTFDSLKSLYWRNSILDFESPKALLRALDRGSNSPVLLRGRPSDDYLALSALSGRDDIMARAKGADAVRLLWEICQIPDFRKTLSEAHQDLVAAVFRDMVSLGHIPEERLEAQISRLDHTEGDVDTLMARIAHIRTWTYITHKSEWLENAEGWQERARGVEDRLSDALHEALTRRFVDRRAAILMRAVETGSDLLAGVRPNGEVVVEGQEVGLLQGFRFIPDETASIQDLKAVMAAARNALKPEIKRRLKDMLQAEAKQLKLTEDGKIFYQPDASNPLPGVEIGFVKKGASLLQPDVEVAQSDLLAGVDREAVLAKLREWIELHIKTTLEPLFGLEAQEGEGVDGNVRGISFQLHEALGIKERASLEDLITGLTPESRRALRNRRIKLGPILVFMPDLNKPAAIRLRATLWYLWQDKALPAQIPQAGVTSVNVEGKDIDKDFYRAIGYPVYGPRAIRIDMLDRVISAIYDNAKDGKFQAKHEMAEWLGCPINDLYAVLEAMGHQKVDAPAAVEATPAPAAEGAAPAEEVKAEEAPVAEASAEEAKAEEAKPEEVKTEEAPATEAKPEEAAAAAKPARPDLAFFRLRRGKAYGGGAARAPREAREPREKKFGPDKKKGGEQKSFAESRRSKGKGDKADKGEKKPFDKKPYDKKGGRPDRDNREDRVMLSTGPKLENSPFAMLKQIQSKD